MTVTSIGDTRHHVNNLLARYAEHADEPDALAVAELFADASVSFSGTLLRGRDAVAAHYRTLFADAPRSRHLLSNLIVERTGPESAVARCRYSRWALEPDATLLAIGDYRAGFARHDDRWRFTTFEVRRTWRLSTRSNP